MIYIGMVAFGVLIGLLGFWESDYKLFSGWFLTNVCFGILGMYDLIQWLTLWLN